MTRKFVVVSLMVASIAFVGASQRERDGVGSTEQRRVREDQPDDGNEHPRVGEDQPDPGNELAVATQPPIAVTDARTIAVAFVSERARSGIHPEWLGTNVGEAIPFYSTAAAHPLAYEFPILKDGIVQGSVLCGATEGTSAVIAYFPEGQTIAATLRENVQEALNHPVEAEARYLYGGASQFGIEVRPVDSANLAVGSEALTVIPEEGTILYSFGFVPISRYDWDSRFRADFRVSRQWIEQERTVRTDLLTKPEHTRIQANASQPKVTTGILPNSNFADFYQKDRKWSTNSCLAGCTPIAAAIVFEYWDRDGYPKMIGSDSKNRSHSDVTHDDVVAALDALRQAMGTYCRSDRAGLTPAKNIDDGVESFARSRGYKNSSAKNEDSSRWSVIREEIDAGRPPLLTFSYYKKNGELSAHTAVPYSYVNSSKNDDDSICVRTGWKGDARRCYLVNSSTEHWAVVTRIRPKK